VTFNIEFFQRIFNRIGNDILGWLPTVGGALLLLLLGWIVGRLIQAFLTGLLKRLGLDRLTGKLGISQTLDKAGFGPSVARIVGRFAYWLVLLFFILAAAESLGLEVVAQTFRGFLAFLPQVVVAAIILLFGNLFAKIIGDTIGALAVKSEIAAGDIVGTTIRYILLVFVVILALEQLHVQTAMLTNAALALIGALALALAIAFGSGTRTLAQNIMAGFYVKDEFKVGQKVKVHQHSGEIISMGTVKTTLKVKEQRISLPNSVLTEEEVSIVSDSDE